MNKNIQNTINTTNIHSPFQYIWQRSIIITTVLAFMVIISAMGVVFTKHTTRILHAKTQAVLTKIDGLNNERSQLLLEKATWLADARVEAIAREQLNMVTPTKSELIGP